MNRLTKIARGLSVKSGLGAYDRILMDRLQGVGDSSGDFLLEEAYEKIDLVYSCISYTSKAIAQIPLQVVQFSNKSNKFEPVGDDNPWQRVIDQPNYMTSKIQFVTGLISFLLLDGCVAIIPFPPSPVANPDALWTIRWEHIEYELDKNNHLIKWTYKPQGDQGVKYEFKPWEVFQIKFWNPEHPIEGWAPIKAGRLPVQELYKSSQYNQRFFDKGAIPGGVLSTSQTLKKPDIDLIKSQWSEHHQSWMKSWEPAVLHRDLKWEPTGISQKDMDFINMRDKSNESIMQIFGMKKVILGKTDSLNYSVAREQRKEWWAGTCLPLMRLTSDALTFGLFRSPQNYERFKSFRVQFDISAIEALHEDYSAKVKTGEGLFRMGVPFEEINEMLELGFENKAWYTLAFVPVNMMCVNYLDVGRDNPMPPGQDVNTPTPDQVDAPKPEENPEDASSDAAQVLFDYMEETREAQINRIVDIGYPSSKLIHNRIRRHLFDMRAKCLQILMDNKEKPLGVIKGMITSHDFNSEFNKLKEGVILLWNETLEQIEKVVEVPKEKLDNSGICAIRQIWITRFFDELAKLVNVKKNEVEGILTKEDSVDKAAGAMRRLFNLSLNEVWPLVKAEVRRQVVLVLGTV